MCGASGTLLLLGGWCGVMWAFLRSLSLHLQICWQVLVGRRFMIFSQAAGWGIPLLGIILALVFSGVSFRFGPTCHINHKYSLVHLWIPLLIFAGATVILTFATFGYCVKVYLASLHDSSASTEGSNLPTYGKSIRTVSPRQAYRRVRRVIALQWRGIAIVLIIIADVIFFSVVFVFQDNVVQSVAKDPSLAKDWIICLIAAGGDKSQCFNHAGSIIVNEATVSAVVLLLALNGIWLLFLLGRISMFAGWCELFVSHLPKSCRQKEFVSVDACYETKKQPRISRSYEMLSRDSSLVTAQYHVPPRSFSSPRAPQTAPWDVRKTYTQAERPEQPGQQDMNPLGMNTI
ncbi:hypothetical protein ED733_005463 [Metarhizium rileyi]|uniref:G-protein coupled receptors family 2 profile 2 domain-containing protein n=1 Tax=Metarhizium rileyi (strain RCEF 4871) TaxID=1649241 RepID=A0A5C6GA57_METRR|nr:hypothetical protein ED733_005463 [Metarhizium rileyi]